MAVRYSGKVRVSVSWHDKGHYDALVSAPGEKPERMTIGRPPAARGSADSPAAYDEVASAAISFSSDSMQEQAEINRQGTGWAIFRSAQQRPKRVAWSSR